MNSDLFFENERYISAKNAGSITGYSQDYIGQLCRGNKILGRRVGRVWYVSEKSILEYKKFLESDSKADLQEMATVSKSRIPEINNSRQISVGKIVLESKHLKTKGLLKEVLGNFGSFRKVSLASVGVVLFFGVLFSVGGRWANLSNNISNLPQSLYATADEVSGLYAKTLEKGYLTTGRNLFSLKDSVVRQKRLALSSPQEYLAQKITVLYAAEKNLFDLAFDTLGNFGSTSYTETISFVSDSMQGVHNIGSYVEDPRKLYTALAIESENQFNPVDSTAAFVYQTVNSFFDWAVYSPFVSLFDLNPKIAVMIPTSKPVEPKQPVSISPSEVGIVPSAPRTVIITPAPQVQVVERTIERFLPSGLTQTSVNLSLQELYNKITSETNQRLNSLSTGSGGSITNVYQQIANSQKIDNLYNTRINNPTITGGSISNSSISATSFSADTGSFTTLSFPTATISGVSPASLLSVNSIGLITATSTPTFGNFNATSTIATSTIALGGFAIGDSHFIVQQNSGRIGIGTTSPSALLELLQTSNGLPIISAYRNTDTAPSGDFINYKTKGGTTLFRVDNSGNLLAGGIVTSGSQTITSISTPQFRLQYDSSNELTFSTTNNGSTTIATNGTNSSLNFIPQNNQTQAFSFQTAGMIPVLSIDTLNQRVGIGTTTPTATFSVKGNSYLNGNVGIGSFPGSRSLTITQTEAVISLNSTSTATGNHSMVMLDNQGTGSNYSQVRYLNSGTAYFSAGIDPQNSFAYTIGNGGNVNVNPLLTITTSGNVGIGTTSPYRTLSVQGSGVFTGGDVLASTFTATSSISTPSLTLSGLSLNSLLSTNVSGVITATSTPTFGNFNATSTTATSTLSNGGLAIGTNHFVVQQNSGRVGIGTTSPGGILSVANSNGQEQLRVTNTASAINYVNITGGGSGIGPTISSNGSGTDIDLSINSKGTGEIDFATGGGRQLSIQNTASANRYIILTGSNGGNPTINTSAGNFSITPTTIFAGSVGISTSSPYRSISVSGSGVFTGGDVLASTFTATSSISTPSLTLSGTSVNSLLSTDSSGVITATSTPTFGNFNATSTTATSTIAGGFSVANTGLVYDFSSGNVGIGTSRPSQKLHVAGSIQVGAGNFIGDGNNSGGYIGFASGNVDIAPGSAASSRLSVNTQGTSITGGVGGNAGLLIVDRTDGSTTFPIQAFKFGGTELARINGTGNLGIGITNPLYGVTIASSTGAQLSLSSGSGISQWVMRNAGGNFYLATTTTTGNATTTTSAFTILGSSGNVGIGTTTPSQKLSVAGDILGNTIIGTNFVATSTTATSTIAGGLAVGTNYLNVLQNGNVGIGTTNPNATLNVAGSFLVSASGNSRQTVDSSVSNNEILGTSADTSSLVLGRYGADTAEPRLYFAKSRAASVGGSGAVVSGDNLGGLFFLGDDGTTLNTRGARILAQADGTVSTGVIPGRLTFGTASSAGTMTERLRIDSSGNVGIGTTNPLSKLDVVGAITTSKSGGGEVRYSGSNGYYSFMTSTMVRGANQWTVSSLGVDGNAADDSVTNDLLTVDYTGSVGIGTTTLDSVAKLTIVTTTTGLGNLLIGSGALFWGGGAEGTALRSQAGAADPKPFTIYASPTILYGGNVGIGDNTPDFKLDVWGTICQDTDSNDTCDGAVTSDSRLKVNVETISSPLKKLALLRGVYFDWDETNSVTEHLGRGTRQVGVIAQEVEAVFPSLIYQDSNGYKMVDYQKLVSPLISAVNELNTRTLAISTATTTPSLYITSNANIGIGTSTPTSKLHVYSNVSSGGVATFQDNNASCTIDPTNATLSCSSDQTLKKDITSLAATTTLDKLLQLRPVTYRWKGESDTSTTHTGFIAQEVEQVFPEFVSTNTNGTKSVAYSNFVPVMVQAIQALNTKTNAIDARLTNLEGLVGSSTSINSPGVMESIFGPIGTWLANATNGITSVVANAFHAKEEICVDDQCLNKDDVRSLLALVRGTASSTPPVSSDTSSPVITIFGNNPAQITVGTSYVDLGATVTDTNELGVVNNGLGLYFTVDGNSVTDITIDTSASTTSPQATTTHTVIYSAVDMAGNWAYATRTIEVLAQ